MEVATRESSDRRETARRRRTSGKKRLFFASIVLLGLAAAVELICLVGLWTLDGWVSFAALHEQRQRLASPAIDADAPIPEAVHPYVGWVLNPEFHNAAGIGGEAGTQDSGLVVNRLGFRGGAEPVQKRSPEKLIVGIFGGSVAQHVAAVADDVLGPELRNARRFRGREVVVVSLTLSGHKQPQQLAALCYVLALGGEFDLVVNIDGYNEIALYPAEDARQSLSTSYPRGWYRRVQELPDPAVLESRLRLAVAGNRRQQWAGMFDRRPLRYSATCNFLWRCGDESLQKSIERDRLAVLSHAPTRKPGFQETGPREKFDSDDAMYAELVRLWADSSRQMHRLCLANGIEFHHVLQPNQYLPGSKPMSADERMTAIYEDSLYGQAVERGYPLLIEAGEELRADGVRFHDLTRLFADVAGPIYADNCCHYNDEGTRLLAVEISGRIAAAEGGGDD